MDSQDRIHEELDKVRTKEDVPILIAKVKAAFKVEKKGNFYAKGSLIGHFYTIKQRVVLNNVHFLGNFEGTLEKESPQFYFQGTIDNFYLLEDNKDNKDDNKDKKIKPQVFQELQNFETSFKGFFKGNFYEWPSSIHYLVNPNSQAIIKELKKQHDPKKVQGDKFLVEWKQEPSEILLPTLVRFEVEDIREVNLQKSLAVMSGIFHIEIHYNSLVQKLVQYTRENQEDKGKYQKLLQIQLRFQRDHNLTLSLAQEGDDNHSESSEWSIIDKTWDINFEDDKKHKIYRFTAWKRFKTEIDNSYGSFFAPFNLNTLRIVMDMSSFLVKSPTSDRYIKIHLIGMNLENDESNPFSSMEELSAKARQARFFKINRAKCRNWGVYIIADNRLTLFPHFRNILINKNSANEDIEWTWGRKDKWNLIKQQMPQALKISQSYANYKKEENDPLKSNEPVKTFAFQKWKNIIVEVPIFKYIVIDMLVVFVPLFLLSALSLLIFNQTNGVSDRSGFTTLAYRLLSISSMMIAYVSLIPVIRQSLPPMPGTTLIQWITYICLLPNFLSLLSAMLDYTTALLAWESGYKLFKDCVFVIAFVMTIVNFLVLLLVFLVYFFKDYCFDWKNRQIDRSPVSTNEIKSQDYRDYMAQVQKNRKQYFILRDPKDQQQQIQNKSFSWFKDVVSKIKDK